MKSIYWFITFQSVSFNFSIFFIFFTFNFLPAIQKLFFKLFILQGVRIVQITKPQNLLDILDAEIDYLENCVDNPFGELMFRRLVGS